jgi:hypothetical protein
MDVTIEMTGKFKFLVCDVAHPTHAVNRMKKYLRTANFSLIASPRTYHPGGVIITEVDKRDLLDNISVEHVTDPSTWFDKREVQAVERALQHVDPKTARKVRQVISEGNALNE